MNMKNRIFAVSDIHGRHTELDMLIKEAGYDIFNDKLFLLGDYVDLNDCAASRETLQYVMQLAGNGAVALKGNNELKYLDIFDPGRTVSDFINSLPSIDTYQNYIFVHAGIRPGIPLDAQKEYDLLNIREEFYNYPAIAGKTVVFGHTPSYILGADYGEIFVAEDKICIDTGAKHGFALSLVELNQRKVYKKLISE